MGLLELLVLLATLLDEFLRRGASPVALIEQGGIPWIQLAVAIGTIGTALAALFALWFGRKQLLNERRRHEDDMKTAEGRHRQQMIVADSQHRGLLQTMLAPLIRLDIGTEAGKAFIASAALTVRGGPGSVPLALSNIGVGPARGVELRVWIRRGDDVAAALASKPGGFESDELSSELGTADATAGIDSIGAGVSESFSWLGEGLLELTRPLTLYWKCTFSDLFGHDHKMGGRVSFN